MSAYAMHHITLADISIYTEEFTVVDLHEQRQRQQSAAAMKSPSDTSTNTSDHEGGGSGAGGGLFLQDSLMNEQFYSTISEFPIPELQVKNAN